MTDAQKKKLIIKHVKLARKYFLVPEHVKTYIFFTEEGVDGDALATARCSTRYDHAELRFAINRMDDEEELVDTVAHEVAHVAQMASDETFEDALLILKGKASKVLHNVFITGVEKRTCHLTRMYMRDVYES